MNQPRSSVSAALFAQLAAAYNFAKCSRAVEIPADVALADQPAFFLLKADEDVTTPDAWGARKYELHYAALVYLHADAVPDDIDHLTVIENILDGIDAALSPLPGEPNTLGGLVINAGIDGKVEIVTGILGGQCVIVAPLIVTVSI